MKPAISVRDLSKSYRIVHQTGKRYRTLRDDLVDGAKRIFSGKFRSDTGEEFWALRDVSFDLFPGDIVGVIGRNGAGKSTLLKVLSRITPPTHGEIFMRGRIGSLLEVGTGFHPELTGRENIFLSGAILGMKRREVVQKFDEIVAFSEVEKFLDTPVKRYSSGMYVRLAFAVAAHLETEILLVDEVLAVGDAKFQEKCVGKLEQVGSTGRTIIFVSHNMGLINKLCKSAILLKNGSVVSSESKDDAISRYLVTDVEGSGEVSFKPTYDFLSLLSARVIQGGAVTSRVKSSLPIELEFELSCALYSRNLICGFVLIDEYGSRFMSTYFNDLNLDADSNDVKGTFLLKCHLPPHVLNEGRFTAEIDVGWANVQRVTERHIHMITFHVENIDGVATHIGMGKNWRPEPMLPDYPWTMRPKPSL